MSPPPARSVHGRYTISVRNVSSTEVESVLTVTNVSAKDGGQLTCRAVSEAGTAEHTVRVIVQSEWRDDTYSPIGRFGEWGWVRPRRGSHRVSVSSRLMATGSGSRSGLALAWRGVVKSFSRMCKCVA